MRAWMLTATVLATLFFVGFFTYTFVARQHVNRLARDYVTEKTEQHAEPAVDLAEEALRSKIVQRFLTKDQTETMEQEIAEYRKNPKLYIGRLTGQAARAPVHGRINHPLVAKVTRWKEGVREYYDSILSRLIWDLRIFAGSSIVAGALAAAMAYRARGRQAARLLGISMILAFAMIYGISMYVHSLTFFKILLGIRLGWSYPGLLALTFINLYLKSAWAWPHLSRPTCVREPQNEAAVGVSDSGMADR